MPKRQSHPHNPTLTINRRDPIPPIHLARTTFAEESKTMIELAVNRAEQLHTFAGNER